MTKKPYQNPKKMLRNILIIAGTVAAVYNAPKAWRSLVAHMQDADYAEEHHAIKHLSHILSEREENAFKVGGVDDPNDPFVKSITNELNARKKRHEAEKKNAKCRYCELEKMR
ncbi:MAG: hypothetical protein SPL08_01165 [Pseudomonadota bacterium]|nr:hypothetical protein [Pseudomonadota bacterium]